MSEGTIGISAGLTGRLPLGVHQDSHAIQNNTYLKKSAVNARAIPVTGDSSKEKLDANLENAV